LDAYFKTNDESSLPYSNTDNIGKNIIK